MVMRMSISQAAMVVLAGCGVTATEYPAANQEALTAPTGGPPRCSPNSNCIVGGCPDPKIDCTHPNGPGVFFEERGSVGINAPPPGDNIMMMITEFTNKAAAPPQGSLVTFRGRYSNPFAGPEYPSGEWLWTEGTIESADYTDLNKTQRVKLQVVALSEQQTMPTWMLVDPSAPQTLIPVRGDQFLHLTLHVTFSIVNPGLIPAPLTPVHVLLDFGPKTDIEDTTPGHPVLYASNLRWSPDGVSSPPSFQYCYRGPNYPNYPDLPTHSLLDQVVFQQGISVDPVNGTVKLDPNVVTMSCAWGSVAKVYNWGYSYIMDPQNPAAFDLYRAAIHMKRAAYCGDSDYHTVDGLRIGILDNTSPKPINSPPDSSSNFVLEAQWSPEGATCLTLANQRDLNSPFTKPCPNKQPLPDCPAPSQPDPLPPPSSPFLESYADPNTQHPPVQ